VVYPPTGSRPKKGRRASRAHKLLVRYDTIYLFYSCMSVSENISLSVSSDTLRVCVQPHHSAVNTTLPAFATERRATTPLLLGAGAGRCRSISPVRMALSSKPTARRCCCRSTGQTDGRTDARPFHRPCAAYFAAVSTIRHTDLRW